VGEVAVEKSGDGEHPEKIKSDRKPNGEWASPDPNNT
jgi:hypothetical protein